MNAEQIEREIKACGREPRKCFEYEEGARHANEGRAPREDWPVPNSLSFYRYTLGYLEAKRDH